MEPTDADTEPDARLSRAQRPAEDALRLHPFYRGKVQTAPKVPVRDLGDFAIWYTPGVAAPCRAIAADPALVFEHTNRANTIAIVSDGSRVLGLGDIGPEAGLPVMEGKALLFKVLGGIDAVPLCVATSGTDELVALVEALVPSFGGINLEDIAAPRCFAVLERLRASLPIPVWHDDQQGTATVVLAALENALVEVGKRLDQIDVTLIGIGAANMAVLHLLEVAGVDPGRVVAVDRVGTLHPDRDDIAEAGDHLAAKWRVCTTTNRRGVRGGVAEALDGADVCLAFSHPGPGTIEAASVATMAPGAIVFACANPTPEIWPWEAAEAGARVVATGRSDFPNQVNNSLGFPGIFRGVLDVRAHSITDEMALAAAGQLAAFARERGLDRGLLPRMDEWEVVPRIAAAVGAEARRLGLAGVDATAEELEAHAAEVIGAARHLTERLMADGTIAPIPDEVRGPAR